MNRSDTSIDNNNLDDWSKFSKFLWFEKSINIWLDISKVNFNQKSFEDMSNEFIKVFKSLDDLEAGAISNVNENRMVGHYWLRNSSISPTNQIKEGIDNEILKVKEFGKDIISGNLVNNYGQKFTDVLWIGIGGSSLGPLLITESLQKKHKGLNFSFVDNIDPNLINEKLIELEDKLSCTLFVVVSKSGGTPEPRLSMEIIRRNLEDKGINWPSQAIAITMSGSNLYQKAKAEKWLRIFDLPDWVGGRTSITSSVGLLPLVLIDESIDDFLQGSSKMDELTRTKNVANNPSALLALSWFFCGEGIGKRDMVVLPYRDRLQVFSKYLQQLVMESLGKKTDRSGKTVHQGISVFGNKGSTDQHAYVQQLRDGIDNFFCIFIELLDTPENLKIYDLEDPKTYLSGFFQGTRLALSNEGRQSVSITLEKLNCFSLGALIALFERAVSFYAEIININAYDQPGVEAGKKAASDVIYLQQKIKILLDEGNKLSLSQINVLLNNSDKETIFLILRQMCFKNNFYSVIGDWSKPDSLFFKKI
tara:strand:- start:1349 stop:2950 length:1602 start_codon:yes stop_codon:yes gene_type:complete